MKIQAKTTSTQQEVINHVAGIVGVEIKEHTKTRTRFHTLEAMAEVLREMPAERARVTANTQMPGYNGPTFKQVARRYDSTIASLEYAVKAYSERLDQKVELAVAEVVEEEPTVEPMELSEKSEALFIAMAEEAGNWGGTPHMEFTRSEQGNLSDLKRKGLVETARDEEGVNGGSYHPLWVTFTEAGQREAAARGIDLGIA